MSLSSKSSQSYVVKSCKPAAGAQKTFTDSIFVGMTRNTGHRRCNRHSNRIEDLVHVKTCGSSMDDDELGLLISVLPCSALFLHCIFKRPKNNIEYFDLRPRPEKPYNSLILSIFKKTVEKLVDSKSITTTLNQKATFIVIRTHLAIIQPRVYQYMTHGCLPFLETILFTISFLRTVTASDMESAFTCRTSSE